MRIFFIVYLFCFVGAFAQEKEVLTGHVFEIENDSLSPLPGVHVYYLGTKQGSTTNDKGFFQLNHDHCRWQELPLLFQKASRPFLPQMYLNQ